MYLAHWFDAYKDRQEDFVQALDSYGRGEYIETVLRQFIRWLEKGNHELDETLLERFGECLIGCQGMAGAERNHVSYFLSDDDQAKVRLYEEPSVIAQQGSTGHRTWEAALALTDYIVKHKPAVSAQQFIELGAGTGLVGIAAHQLGAVAPGGMTVLTDGDDKVVGQLQQNIELNHLDPGTICAKKLWWGEDSPREFVPCGASAIVACADVTYDDELIPDLAQCLRDFLLLKETKFALLSATMRSMQTFDVFRHSCAVNNIELTEVASYSSPFEGVSFFIPPKSPDIIIFKLTRKG